MSTEFWVTILSIILTNIVLVGISWGTMKQQIKNLRDLIERQEKSFNEDMTRIERKYEKYNNIVDRTYRLEAKDQGKEIRLKRLEMNGD
jgi:hypothetical protein